MQYIYTECKLPSNGKLYPTTTVHLRPKTIFDIKMLLNYPVYMIKSEIDTLQNCLDPKDNINVYDLVNQDVVYLLYKLRSMSDDSLTVKVNNEEHTIAISEMDVKYLDEWDNVIELPDSKWKVELAYQPIRNMFKFGEQKEEFLNKYPDYVGDVENTLMLINAINSIDGVTTQDHIRNKLEQLDWNDSLFLIEKIENLDKELDFGIKEEFEVVTKEGEKITVPIQITESFFRPSSKH